MLADAGLDLHENKVKRWFDGGALSRGSERDGEAVFPGVAALPRPGQSAA